MALQKVTIAIPGVSQPTNLLNELTTLPCLLNTSFDTTTNQLTATITGPTDPLLSNLPSTAAITSQKPHVALMLRSVPTHHHPIIRETCQEFHCEDIEISETILKTFFAGHVPLLLLELSQHVDNITALHPIILRIHDITHPRLITALQQVGAFDIYISTTESTAKFFYPHETPLLPVVLRRAGINATLVPPLVLNVVGMMCTGCTGAVQRSAEAAGAGDVLVDLDAGKAFMYYDGDEPFLINEIKEGSDKDATVVHAAPLDSHLRILHVQRMTGITCLNAVTNALREVDGAADVNVYLETGLATVLYAGDEALLIKAVSEGAGKNATLVDHPGFESPHDTQHTSKPVTLRVNGMTCMSCVNAVTNALQEVDGTANVNVDLETGLATLSYTGDESLLVKAVSEGAGKEAKLVHPGLEARDDTPQSSKLVTLRVNGMTCMSCVKAVTNALQEVDGATDVNVDLETGLATLLYTGAESLLIKAVSEGAGKEVKLVDPGFESRDEAQQPIGTITLRVDGMTCMRCVNAVTKALQEVEGTNNVEVVLATGLATLSYSGAESVLIEAVSQGAGKQATLVVPALETRNEETLASSTQEAQTQEGKTVTLRVDGMTDMRCVNAVTTALQEVSGTGNVHVDIATKLATLSYAGDESVLIQAISNGAEKEAELVVNSGFESRDEVPLLSVIDNFAQKVSRFVTLRVIGMTCMRCVSAVTKALQEVDGTERVAVDLATGLATLYYTDDESTLIQAIFQEAGKEAVVAETERASRGVTLRVEGMTCMTCVGKVTRALSALETAEDVQVSLDTGLATLSFVGEDEQLIEAVAKAGKTATVVTADQESMTELSLGSPTKSDHELIDFGSLVDSSNLTTTQLRVEGMTCASCVGVVEGLLKKLPGVSSAKVNLLAGRATVMHDDMETTAAALSEAVSASGYPSIVLDSSNPDDRKKLSEQDRAFRIDFPTDLQADNALKSLRYLDGVKSVTASYSTVTITLNPGVPKSMILRVLEVDGSFGKMFLRQSDEEEREAMQRGDNEGPTEVIDKEVKMWWNKLLLAAFLFTPIGITSLTCYFYGSPSVDTNAWIHFLLATPIQFISGAGFYRSSYYALKKRRATMDCLIALSTSIAYFSSVIVVLMGLGRKGDMGLGHSAMFRTSAMILVMVLIGKYIESRSKKAAANGVAEISGLTPNEAILYDEKEEVSCFTVIPAKLVDVGDVVKVIPGDKIPVDGDVIDGVSAVDESMMTGESTPFPKSQGDHVIGGTVNGSGSMLIRATAVGADSVLAQIVKLVNDAQTSRAPVEAFADAVSAVFVPVVIAISILVFFVWFGLATMRWIPEDWYAADGEFFFALLFALETMVIACPCALGLATPTAVMVASSVGTKIGVLFRSGGAAIEAANNVKTVLFDKTGTLTKGKPAVVGTIMGKRGKSVTEQANVILSDLIYLVEAESHHPLAAAIIRHIETKMRNEFNVDQDHNLPAYKISSMEEVPGRGIIASINKGKYTLRIGSASFVFSKVSREDVLTSSEIRTMDKMEQENGLTLVSAVVNNELACVFGLEDTIRDEAADVVETLHSMGVQTGLITGDSHETGCAIAAKAGIPSYSVHAQALPWTKVAVVEENQPACFVGDGMNDAPALAAASLGIAIGAGAPVAAESAAVVLVGPCLEGVVNALDLARTTFRRVRLNFIWAIGYNVLGIPLAAGVLYPFFKIRVPPVVASGAMALSSTCVILSSLFLYLYKPRVVKKEGEMTTRDSSVSRPSYSRDDIIDVPLLSAEV